MHHYTFVTAVPRSEVSGQNNMHSWNIFVKATPFATYCKETKYNSMYKSSDMKNLVAQNLITPKTFTKKIHPHINFFIIISSRIRCSPRRNSLRVESNIDLYSRPVSWSVRADLE
jgi:hypothetical protein